MAEKSPKAQKPNWFSIREAADYLDVGEPTIYRWMREGRMTFRKVGDSTRFLQEDLDAMVQVHPSEKDIELVRSFCPACHHSELIDGDVRSTGLVYFHPKKSCFWVLQESVIPVTARMCTRCGNIMLSSDAEKLNALRKTAAKGEAEAEADGADA